MVSRQSRLQGVLPQADARENPLDIELLTARLEKQGRCKTASLGVRCNTWLVAEVRKEKQAVKQKAKYLRRKAILAVNLQEASDGESASSLKFDASKGKQCSDFLS